MKRRFVPAAQSVSSLRLMLGHLRNRPLLATYLVGSCIFFSMLAIFTYVNFHLAAPPFYLGTAALGYVFLVYLVGGVITPVAGRWIDSFGYRNALVAATAVGIAGVLLTLANSLWIVVAGLAIFSSATFHHPGQRQQPHRQSGGAQPCLGRRSIRFVLLSGRWPGSSCRLGCGKLAAGKVAWRWLSWCR